MNKRINLNAVDQLFMVVIPAIIIFVYRENMIWLWNSWNENPNYSHGFMIPFISFFIIYQKRKEIKNAPIEENIYGIVITIVALIIYFVSLRMQVKFLISYSMILLLIGITAYMLGNKRLKIVMFPICYLVFMVPFWAGVVNKVSNGLKILSSILSQNIVELFGISVYREGAILQLTKGTLEVADPCSGIRSIISLLAVGVLFAYFSKGSIIKRSMLVLSAIPLAFFFNTIRVVFLIYMLEIKGILLIEGTMHTLSGIMVFMFAMLMMMAMKKWLKI